MVSAWSEPTWTLCVADVKQLYVKPSLSCIFLALLVDKLFLERPGTPLGRSSKDDLPNVVAKGRRAM